MNEKKYRYTEKQKIYYKNLPEQKKLENFETAKKRINDNEIVFMRSRFNRIKSQEKHSKSKYDNKIYKCCFSFEEFLKICEPNKIDHAGVFCAISGYLINMIGL